MTFLHELAEGVIVLGCVALLAGALILLTIVLALRRNGSGAGRHRAERIGGTGLAPLLDAGTPGCPPPVRGRRRP